MPSLVGRWTGGDRIYYLYDMEMYSGQLEFSGGVGASGKICRSSLASCIVQLSVHGFFVVVHPLYNAVY